MVTPDERVAMLSVQVGEHERRLNSINGGLDRVEERLGKIEVGLNTVAVKIGLAAAAGALVASPVVGGVVYALTH